MALPEHSPELKFAVLAADVVLFTIDEEILKVRVIQVNRPPYYDHMVGLPGGLLLPHENAEESARRHLKEKAGIQSDEIYLEQLYTFSKVDRDKRGRVVAVAYHAFIPWEKLSDAEKEPSNSWWVPVVALDNLAYDHDEMLALAVERLRSRAHYTTLMSKLMPAEFTLTELEKAYEVVLAKDLDKRNFRKKLLKLNVLTELPRKRTGGKFRPAQLYTFTSSDVISIEVL
jgi:8-oxo-dGTP diphosphatase